MRLDAASVISFSRQFLKKKKKKKPAYYIKVKILFVKSVNLSMTASIKSVKMLNVIKAKKKNGKKKKTSAKRTHQYSFALESCVI